MLDEGNVQPGPRGLSFSGTFSTHANAPEQMRYNELMDLVTAEMLSSLTPENVIEETFSGSSLCAALLMDIRHVTNN